MAKSAGPQLGERLMSTSLRYAATFLAIVIVIAGSALGPAVAGGPSLRVALEDSNPQHCKPAPDGSQICTYDPPGPGSAGGPDPNSPYMACRIGCGERSAHQPMAKRESYLQQCLAACARRYSQRVRG
jgi:hypothetical protein